MVNRSRLGGEFGRDLTNIAERSPARRLCVDPIDCYALLGLRFSCVT